MKALEITGDRRGWIKRGLALSIAVWALTICALWPAHGSLLSWDEVDYVQAARLGLVTNMFDRGSLSPWAYIEQVKRKLAKQPPNLPEGYAESHDPVMLRHYHPPLVVIMISAFASYGERWVRFIQLLGALCLLLSVGWAYLLLSPKPSWMGLGVTLLLGFWMSLILFTSLNFHGWEAIGAVGAGLLTAAYLNSGRRIHGAALCVCLAYCLLVLETGIFVLLLVLLYFFIWRARFSREGDRARVNLRSWMFGLGLVAMLVLLIWPGIITSISPVKNIALHLYRIKFGQEYESVGGKAHSLALALAPMLLILFAIVVVWLKAKAGRLLWMPLAVIGVGYCLAISPFALSPTYILPAAAPLACFVGLSTDYLRSVIAKSVIAVMAVALIIISWRQHNPFVADQQARKDLMSLSAAIDHAPVLADGGHIYQYYWGAERDIQAISVSYDANKLMIREAGQYRAVSAKEIDGRFVLLQKRSGQPLGSEVRRLLGKCQQSEYTYSILWDCRAIESELR